ncbi:vegetatible incompatibility het-e-1 [Fusarium beomiforme]|uniref:Vegetatible incompatibility het-e-1 n=1 Tax=Fusarium beomiforme TaxID=44412 RepID=A0A9P5A752_9HYPO|nr:vegetatible incompatibility het-e-1 [Fusarium beomiforme]
MRRAALDKSKSRLRENLPPAANTTASVADSSLNVVESLIRDEGRQSEPQQLAESLTTSNASSNNFNGYSQSHTGQLQYNSALLPATEQSYNFSEPAADSPMTDALPAEVDTTSATANTIAAPKTPSLTIVTDGSPTAIATESPFQDNYDQFTTNTYTYIYNTESESSEPEPEPGLDQDHQNDVDIDLDTSIQPPLLDDSWTPPAHLDLDPDYVPHYHDVDYDIDMSDSEGGAPLDDTLDELENFTDGQSIVSEGDDDVSSPVNHPINSLSHTLFHPPTVIDTDLIMNAAPPPVPWGVAPDEDTAAVDDIAPPLPTGLLGLPLLSNPNPTMLGSENLCLVDFLRHWAYQARSASCPSASRVNAPCPEDIRRQANAHVREVRYEDLHGDGYDMQGLDWTSMNTTRKYARQIRCATFKNYVNKEGSDRWSPHMVDVDLPPSQSFMRFKKFLVRQDVYLAHFQLRSVLACPSISQVYYPGRRGINRINPVTGKTELVLNNSHLHGLGALISTLDANHGAMFAGTFNGEYYLKSLDSEDKNDYAEGVITPNVGGITNHVQIYQPRQSSGPVAAISSNDEGFRLLDLTTQQFLMQSRYRFPLNCSRISPDGRLRVMVGDDFKVLITNADTGEIQQELSGHRDYGFACDWSDDGWTVATGFQDKGVKVWDARRWCDSRGVSKPLCTIRSEMAGVRNLRFSPVGSGQRVLIAAEEADFINIINAQTFSKKQTVDFFGEIGGIAFTNDGQDLNVLASDRHRGGLLQLERCGRGPEPFLCHSWRRSRSRDSNSRDVDRWRWQAEELSNREPHGRNPISTDALPIF